MATKEEKARLAKNAEVLAGGEPGHTPALTHEEAEARNAKVLGGDKKAGHTPKGPRAPEV